MKNALECARPKRVFVSMSLERQLNQAVEQCRIFETRRFPHLCVHADRREAWNRVELIEE